MNLKFITVSATAAVLAVGAAAASADTTIIGSTGQSNNQGVNSTQSGSNGSGGGTGGTFILGDSAPATIQTSANVLTNDQEIGGGGGDTTLIAPGAGQCFCQSSNQGVNSSQTGVNATGGGTGTTAILGDSAPTLVQTSANELDNAQFIGGGLEDTVLIGGAAQINQQGANSAQTGVNGSAAGGGTFVVGDDSLGLLDQESSNLLTNVVIIGG